jgi:hypothetical protein
MMYLPVSLPVMPIGVESAHSSYMILIEVTQTLDAAGW